jgi:hypothetical protein
MIDQVRAEAEARGDRFAQTSFRRLDAKNFPQGDANGCCVYLFGEIYPEFDAKTGEQLKPR